MCPRVIPPPAHRNDVMICTCPATKFNQCTMRSTCASLRLAPLTCCWRASGSIFRAVARLSLALLAHNKAEHSGLCPLGTF